MHLLHAEWYCLPQKKRPRCSALADCRASAEPSGGPETRSANLEQIPEPLLDDIQSGRCLPFVGAGFSLNARLPQGDVMPDWPGLTEHLALRGQIKGELDGPAVASQYEKKFGRVQLIEAIRSALHADTAEPGEAHAAFAQLAFDTIYTTNFDLLLEAAFQSARRPFRSLVGELQLPFHGGASTTTIVKMHGDLRHEEHMVVTHEDYDEYLANYPLIATHLSGLLIARTALYVGYSLSDPDFQHIRQVVRSRLGKFERMAYVLDFDTLEGQSSPRLEENLHVISLGARHGSTKDEQLSSFFQGLQESVDVREGTRFRSTRPDVFEDLPTAVLDVASHSEDATTLLASTSSLCFVMMPIGPEADSVYRRLIEPTVARYGLVSLRADEISALGSSTEQIRVAIQQSRLCIADVSGRNPNVLYEVSMARTLGKPIVLLAQDTTDVPSDLRSTPCVVYSASDPVNVRRSLKNSIQRILGEDRLGEAERLVDAGLYRAAAAVLGILLEYALRRVLDRSANVHCLAQPERPRGLGQSLDALASANLIADGDIAQLREAINIRNRAVHQLEEPSADDARLALRVVREFIQVYLNETQSPRGRGDPA